MRERNRRKILISSLAVVFAILFIFPSSLSTLRTSNAIKGTTNVVYQQVGYEVCLVDCSTANFYLLSVQSSWVVPTLKCPKTGSSVAVYEFGMDYRSNMIDVENAAGLYLLCDLGSALYYAWGAEAGNAFTLSTSTNPVHPGDHMNAKISFNPISGMFTLVIHDSTHVWTYKPPAYFDTTGNAFRRFALFQVVRGSGTSLYPLPDFVKLSTSADYVTVAASSSSLTGTKGSIGYWYASKSTQALYAVVYAFDMKDSDTSHILATPSSITSTSTGFNIIWKAST
jgi:hypothetical protein